jgi:membrane-bound ClpP family serine protease
MRLIISIVTSLLDEALIVFLILWLLPHFGIEIPLWLMIVIVLAFAAFAVFSYKIGTKTLTKKPLSGFTDMTGKEGVAATDLQPGGYVKIEGELWTATTGGESLPSGSKVIVTGQQKLTLIVARL